jgi:hypothetical protein
MLAPSLGVHVPVVLLRAGARRLAGRGFPYHCLHAILRCPPALARPLPPPFTSVAICPSPFALASAPNADSAPRPRYLSGAPITPCSVALARSLRRALVTRVQRNRCYPSTSYAASRRHVRPFRAASDSLRSWFAMASRPPRPGRTARSSPPGPTGPGSLPPRKAGRTFTLPLGTVSPLLTPRWTNPPNLPSIGYHRVVAWYLPGYRE